MRAEVGPLQVETLRFLQETVDRAYAEGVQKYDAGRLQPRLSRGEAIGNYVDASVRSELRDLFNRYRLPYGQQRDLRINNRDYDTSQPQPSYKIPDARIGNISFDWTLSLKRMSDAQIRGFFSADSNPIGVVIVRPSELRGGGAYLIPRPAELGPGR
jgi:hypothetical protein